MSDVETTRDPWWMAVAFILIAMLTGVLVSVILLIATDRFEWTTLDANVAVSALAIVVASGAAVVTYRQGRVINKIEIREHKWEQADRISAFLEVTRQRVEFKKDLLSKSGRVRDTYDVHFIRVRNTGRATAEDIVFNTSLYGDIDKLDLQGDEEMKQWMINTAPVALLGQIPSVTQLHPGEHIDMELDSATRFGDFGLEVDVMWDDGREKAQRKTTIINW